MARSGAVSPRYAQILFNSYGLAIPLLLPRPPNAFGTCASFSDLTGCTMPMTEASKPLAAPRVETRLVYAHGLAAIVTLLISISFGILASIELLVPDLAGNPPWLSWGRLRY